MVRIGTVFWEAKVSGVSEAAQDAEELQGSLSSSGEAAMKAADAQRDYGESTGTAAEEAQRAERWTTRLQMGQGLLSSAALFVASNLGVAALATKGYSMAMTAASAATSALGLSMAGTGGIVATVSGAFSTIIGYGSALVAALAGTTAGAIALGAALALLVGTVVAWVLEVTGALDVIINFGYWLKDKLPAWAADGLAMLVSVFMGPLAVISGAIVGFVKGGFQGAFDGAKAVVTGFLSAWKNNLSRLMGHFTNFKNSIMDAWDSIKQGAVDMASGVADTITGTVKTAFNTVVPDKLELPQHTISAPDWAGGYSITLGGQSLDLPQLNSGGRIGESGAAVVHKGEEVVQSHVVAQLERSRDLLSKFDPSSMSVEVPEQSGGSETNVENNISVSVDASGFDPSNMSNHALRRLARQIADELGGTTGNLTGGK